MPGSILHTGGCRCGKLVVEASAEPVTIGYCHCTDCRRSTGAPVSAFLGFRAEDVSVSGDSMRSYENDAVVRRFCDVCGSPTAYTDQRLPDKVYVMLGAMHLPANFKPTLHAYVREQLPFVHMSDGLPRYELSSARRPDGTRR